MARCAVRRPARLGAVALVYIDAAPSAPYPSDAELAAFGERNCRPLFADYAAGAPSDLGVFLGEAVPSAADWVAGIRQVLCGAVGLDGAMLTTPLALAG